MAALPCGAAGSFRSRFAVRVSRVNCVSSAFFDRSTGRRNHLRPKILKILKEPIVPKVPDAESIDPICSPPVDGLGAIEEVGEFEKLEPVKEVESTVKSMEGDVSTLDWLNPGLRAEMLAREEHFSFWKYGLFLVGAFVFQKLYTAVLVDDNGSRRIDENERNSVYDMGGNGKEKSVNDLEIEKKIKEIRAMAKEARDMERLELDGKEDDGLKFRKSGIEEEVNNRLNLLKKRLENSRAHDSAASIADDNVSLGVEELLLKYSSRARPLSKAKGFMVPHKRKSSESRKTRNRENESRLNQRSSGDGVAEGNGEDQNDELEHGNSDVSVEEDGKRMPVIQSTMNSRKTVNKESVPRRGGRGDDALKSKVINGIDEEKNVKPCPEVVESGIVQNDATYSGKSQNWEAPQNNVLHGPSGLTSRDLGSEAAGLGEGKGGFWWSNLPYVLVIHMCKGVDGEDGEGLYTLKSLSDAEDQISHMVAFEDRTDAINYCYLLHSFFEDTNDCSLGVVPLPVKELIEGVNSGAVTAFVVKKGALDLYAGQPFADAEMALRHLAEQR